jgi:hypothetical protein
MRALKLFAPVKQSTIKTQNTNPPSEPPPSCKVGPFCIKAVCELIENNETKSEFTGYDTDYSILEKTKRECEKKSHGNESSCTLPKMTAIASHNIANCNGHIIHENFDTNFTSIIFPR